MNFLRRFPSWLRFLFYVTAINFAVFVVFRIVFFLVFSDAAANVEISAILQALYTGFKFDLRLALLIGLPLLLLGAVPFFNPARFVFVRRVWLTYFVVLELAVVLTYFVDFGHYEYLNLRLNAGMVDHLFPISVSMQMVWETYPVIWGLLGLAFIGACYTWILHRTAVKELAIVGKPLPALYKTVGVSIFVVFYLFGMYGKLSWYPLRWSDAYSSTNEYVASLALNPVLHVFETYKNRSDKIDMDIVRSAYRAVARDLGVRNVDKNKLAYRRFITAGNGVEKPYNLVVIHLESYAAFKVGIFGNQLKATPEFDAIANRSLFFTNFFVPVHPTARSVYTMMTGIPDLNPRRSASRNPLIVNQHTYINALKGYDKFYFLGGSATWGNIRALLAHNIPGLKIYEEGSYDAPRTDTWGVSDLDMFEQANQVFRKQKKPFFAFIQTSGNHKPFNLPENLRSFKRVTLDKKTLYQNSFESLNAYNGLRFFDYSLGRFFKLAAKEKYYNNTVFVMYGDHGSHAPPFNPWERLLLTKHHVPFVIYAPGLIKKPRRIDTIASLVDVLPTTFGLMKVSYLNKTLGRDLFTLKNKERRFALHHYGILDDEFYLFLDRLRKPHLYRYRSKTPTKDLSGKYPEITAKMERRFHSIYQTAKYMMSHNSPEPHQAVKGKK